MALIPPFYMDCVVAIGFKGSRGEINWAASGFFYGYKVSGPRARTKSYAIYLVTNKHVFQGEATAYIRCNPTGRRRAMQFPIALKDGKGNVRWLAHQQAGIDVAMIRINPNALSQSGVQFACFRSDDDAADLATLRRTGVTEGDGVFVLGFPMRLVGRLRNTVHIRGGPIARIRDCTLKRNPEFLVDAQVFPGNSGGPVILKPEAIAIEGTAAVGTAYLVGIVKSYVPYQDVAISQQTGRPRVIFEENSGLAAIHPINFVHDIARRHTTSARRQRSN